MPVEDHIYNRAQMNVPPEFPDIIKNFTKACIRTQPSQENMLEWSASYFKCLKEGTPLPVKTRFEAGKSCGLTFGILNILNRQLGPPREQPICVKELRERWQDLGLTEEALDNICVAGNINIQADDATIDMEKFVAISACSLVSANDSNDGNNSTSELGQALNIICELYTNDLEGGASRVDLEQFIRIFEFIGNLKNVPAVNMENIVNYMTEKASRQGGLVMPSNFQSKDCPSF